MLEKFDKIFNKIFKMTANELEKGKPFANAINGIFIRCEINPGKFIKNVKEAYNDLLNLLFMLKIQIWIGNNWNQAMVKKELIDKIELELLIDKIELELAQMMDELPEEMFRFREFQYHLADPDRIRLWPFKSPDKPLPKFHGNCQLNECPYCINSGMEYREESLEWKDCIKEGPLMMQSPNLMMEFIENNKENILPSFLAKSISFDRKLGAALFRNGIEPNYEHPLNAGGGFFRAYLNGTTGNEESLAKFDQIFHLLIDDIANSSEKDSINGIFIRCMINQNSKFYNDFSNHKNLPFTLKLEVWIRKCSKKQQKFIEEALNKNIVEKVKQMGLPERFAFKYDLHSMLKI